MAETYDLFAASLGTALEVIIVKERAWAERS